MVPEVSADAGQPKPKTSVGFNSNDGSLSSNESNTLNEKPHGGGDIQASAKSGYSADGSQFASALAPPVFIDFLDAHKRDDCKGSTSSDQTSSSRRNAIELSYRASRAMGDLQTGGLPIPKIHTGATRDLDGNKVDMSKVKLVSAKTMEESPFLIKREKAVVIPENAMEYESLFVATYQSYEKNDSSQWDSSTSSVTSSESDDAASMPPPALVLHPRLEDALKANAAMKNNGDKTKRVKRKRTAVVDASVPKLVHLTMTEALEAANEARVVTLSFSPFIVVHVNTAYTRLTGYSSAKALGKPLQDCLSSECKDWMKHCISPHPISALHGKVSPIRAKGKKKQNSVRIQASLVGPQLEGKKEVDTSTVTHYTISFLPVPKEETQEDTITPEATATPNNPDVSASIKKARVAVSVASQDRRKPAAPGIAPKPTIG